MRLKLNFALTLVCAFLSIGVGSLSAQTWADLTQESAGTGNASQFFASDGAGRTRWVTPNQIFSGAGGISVSPDQTVAITGTGITVGGTYPNFTLTALDQSPTNELVTAFSIASGNIRLVEAGTTRDIALTGLISGTAGNQLSVNGGLLYVAAQSAPAQLYDEFYTDKLASALAANATYTVTGANLGSDATKLFVMRDGREMLPKIGAATDFDYELLSTNTIRFKNATSIGTRITIRY